MKSIVFKITLILIFLIPFLIKAGNIKGVIIDKQDNLPMVGVTVKIIETGIGTVTDIKGKYELSNISKGKYRVEIRFLSYKTIEKEIVVDQYSQLELNFEMEGEDIKLSEVQVVSKKNYESEVALIDSRKISTTAIENIGSKELSNKGISSAAEGIKKMTGISTAGLGCIIVRGLGDRYSLTTLNSLPIASPNPDNKLIPLELFPTSIIKNITVSKVYNVANYADYSGAHIDISTKENIGENFLSISLQTGGNFNTVFQDFYSSNKTKYGLWGNTSLSTDIKEMSSKEFSSYILNNEGFKTNFNISKQMSLPEWGVGFGYGKTLKIAKGKLELIASLNVDHDNHTVNNAYIATYTAQGTKLNEFFYDSYNSQLNIASLVNAGYIFKNNDRISYTFFYARNVSDNYKYREGFDSEGNNLLGSNSVTHIYSLLNNQLIGKHALGKNWLLIWSGSYGITQSDEPDRRQVMFRKNEEVISLFKLNQQETMRYFGELTEKEYVVDIRTQYIFGENKNAFHIGGSYKNKNRDYSSVRFYYNLNKINPLIDNVYDYDTYLNQENIANKNITIKKDAQPKSNYYGNNQLGAAFIDLDYYPIKKVLINFGVRYEYVDQSIRYWNDASVEKISELMKGDFFPAINIKYEINKKNNLRFSTSRTVTRPSFIEMSPFLYKESYGSAEIRGNENLLNGYNYNIDLKYDFFPKNCKDLISTTLYFKWLQNPIEQVQESAGGAAVYSFRNAENGYAAGVELEIRNEIFHNFRAGINASYMYTNVILPENGGIYTDLERALQGASPYLLNCDISYDIEWKEKNRISFFLLYNLQGPRIHAVGIYGMGNVVQKTVHSLDFVTNLEVNNHWTFKIKLNNLLNSKILYVQTIQSTQKVVEVEKYKSGMGISLNVSYKL